MRYANNQMIKGKAPGNLAFTVSYSIAKDSKNKPAAWTLLTYLTGRAGHGDLDVEGPRAAVAQRRQAGSRTGGVPRRRPERARPWQFAPGFAKVMTVAGNELTAAIEGKQSIDVMLDKIQAEPQRTLSEAAASRAGIVPPRARRARGGLVEREERVATVDADRDVGTMRSAKLREALVGLRLRAVPMTVFAVFFLYPIGYAVYISFFDWGVLGKIDSVGLENYRFLVDDDALPASDQEHRLLHGRRRARADGARPLPGGHRQPGLRGPAFFRAAYYFPALASSAAITRSRSTSSAPTGCSTRARGG